MHLKTEMSFILMRQKPLLEILSQSPAQEEVLPKRRKKKTPRAEQLKDIHGSEPIYHKVSKEKLDQLYGAGFRMKVSAILNAKYVCKL